MFARILLSTAISLAAARAEIINLAFHYNGDTVYEFSERPSGGVVTNGSGGLRYWNNIFYDGGAGLRFKNHGLRNGDGKPKEVKLSVQAGYVGTSPIVGETLTDDHVLYKGWYGFRGGEFLEISNVPARFKQVGYKIILYTNSDNADRLMEYSLNDQSGSVKEEGNYSGELVEGKNIIVFHGLKGGKVVIKGNKNPEGLRSAINGLQLVTDNHAQFYTYHEEGTPEGKAWVRWECGGVVKTVKVLGPNGGVLHQSDQAMGSLLVDAAKAGQCKLVLQKAKGTYTIPVQKK
ncbi:hypothetical protein SAMN02745181_2148 [Rubritalea squalenifaciens DSM 18772]|uniref:Uncharacterized protein n=1 Tax=Rubritalea squalenifaciens DSM 18772 TaxID=1123071 RepID=A0A1M6KMB8_9BACT|nr:hypothetical protein [Rubritalea squalenifaciens]SHJ60069.1 hypothetical protein SAMN02745181_2148 [Rubritalea squalenifaciens DSM 18772]